MSECIIVFSSPDDDGRRFSGVLQNQFWKLGQDYWISCICSRGVEGLRLVDDSGYALALLFENTKLDAEKYRQFLVAWFKHRSDYHSGIDSVVVLRHGRTKEDAPEIYRIQQNVCNDFLGEKTLIYVDYSHVPDDPWYERIAKFVENLANDDGERLASFVNEARRTLLPALADAVNRASHNPENQPYFAAATSWGAGLPSTDAASEVFGQWCSAWNEMQTKRSGQDSLLRLAGALTAIARTQLQKNKSLTSNDAVWHVDHQVGTSLSGLSNAHALLKIDPSHAAISATRAIVEAIIAKNYAGLAKRIQLNLNIASDGKALSNPDSDAVSYEQVHRNAMRFLRVAMRQLTNDVSMAMVACERARDLLAESRVIAGRLVEQLDPGRMGRMREECSSDR